jgi:hypothetical protein
MYLPIFNFALIKNVSLKKCAPLTVFFNLLLYLVYTEFNLKTFKYQNSVHIHGQKSKFDKMTKNEEVAFFCNQT